ncbi:MAG: tetratricopeptide repeat protein [bacterium]
MKTKRLFYLLLGMLMMISSITLSPALAEKKPSEVFHAASQAFWNGEFQRSLKHYRSIVENHPDHKLYWDARFGMAKSFYEMGKLNKARKIFEDVQYEHPDKAVRGDALFSLVEISILQDEIVHARNLLQTFLDVYTDHPIRSAAKQQLKLLEEASVPQPPSVSEDTTSTSDARRTPPKLKSPKGESGKPETLPPEPTTEGSADVNTDTGMEPASPASSKNDTSTPKQNRIRPGADTPAETIDNSEDTSQTASDTVSQSKEVPSKSDNPPSTTASTTKMENDTALSRLQSLRHQLEELRRRQKDLSSRNQLLKRRLQGQLSATSRNNDTSGAIRSGESTGTSLKDLRRQFKRQQSANQLSDAFRTLKKLLNSQSARSRDYYKAAVLARKLAKPPGESLRYLNKAIALSSSTPGNYLLLKSELLLDRGRTSEASSLLGTVNSDYYSNMEDKHRAQYHFLQGELLKTRGNKDESFFEYMSALQTAPESSWGRRAKSKIQSGL